MFTVAQCEARIEEEKKRRRDVILFYLWLIGECRASIAMSAEDDD